MDVPKLYLHANAWQRSLLGKMVVTLGQAPTTSTVTAADDVAALTYGTQVIAVDNHPSQQTGFTLASVGLGQLWDVSAVQRFDQPD